MRCVLANRSGNQRLCVNAAVRPKVRGSARTTGRCGSVFVGPFGGPSEWVPLEEARISSVPRALLLPLPSVSRTIPPLEEYTRPHQWRQTASKMPPPTSWQVKTEAAAMPLMSSTVSTGLLKCGKIGSLRRDANVDICWFDLDNSWHGQSNLDHTVGYYGGL